MADATLHQLSDPAFYALFAAGLLLMVTFVLVKVYKNKCHKTLKGELVFVFNMSNKRCINKFNNLCFNFFPEREVSR